MRQLEINADRHWTGQSFADGEKRGLTEGTHYVTVTDAQYAAFRTVLAGGSVVSFDAQGNGAEDAGATLSKRKAEKKAQISASEESARLTGLRDCIAHIHTALAAAGAEQDSEAMQAIEAYASAHDRAATRKQAVDDAADIAAVESA